MLKKVFNKIFRTRYLLKFNSLTVIDNKEQH